MKKKSKKFIRNKIIVNKNLLQDKIQKILFGLGPNVILKFLIDKIISDEILIKDIMKYKENND